MRSAKMLLVGAVSAVLLLGPSISHGAPILEVLPTTQEVGPGSLVSTDVVISGLGDGVAPSLGSYSITLAFDSSIIQFQSATFGDPILGNQLDLGGFGTFQQTTPGLLSVDLFEVSFDSFSVLDLNQASSFTLFRTQFLSVGIGTSPVSISSFLLGDSIGNAISGVTTFDAEIQSTPEPTSLLLMVGGLVGVFALSRFRRSA